MIRDMIMKMAEQDPQYAQAIDAMEAQVARMPIVPEDLDEIIKVLEFVLQNPDKYQEVRAAAIKDGDIDANMVPEQFDQVFIVSMLVALYGLQDRLKKQGYARGGLAVAARRVAAAGRGGDSQLAHINPREAEMLRRMGGSGDINPNTGLHEYKGLKQIVATVAPIALAVFVPGLGAAIGGALGASGIGASMLGGALIGAGSSALGGGDWKKGALMGGLGGGLGGVVGEGANNALGLGLGKTGQAILGGGLVGGAAGKMTGQGFTKGALQGAAGSGIGQLAGGATGPTAFEQAVGAAGTNFGHAITAGYDPKTAAAIGATAGITTGLMSGAKPSDGTGMKLKPSDAVIEGMKAPSGSTYSGVPEAGLNPYSLQNTPQFRGTGDFAVDYSLTNPNASPADSFGIKAGPDVGSQLKTGLQIDSGSPAKGGILGSGVTAGQALTGLALAGSLQKPPAAAQQAIAQMSPEQQEYFNRPAQTFDWQRLQNDAAASGLDLGRYMAQNWNIVSSGRYNVDVPRLAKGGALSSIARMAQGSGSGRDDTIDAKLSDGEYVMDAETVALLGDGSNKAGAARLDAMREQLRKQKGKVLAKGKFSPNAKSPLAYLKEAA